MLGGRWRSRAAGAAGNNLAIRVMGLIDLIRLFGGVLFVIGAVALWVGWLFDDEGRRP